MKQIILYVNKTLKRNQRVLAPQRIKAQNQIENYGKFIS